MARVSVVRAVAPGMAARGEGYLLHTASAAGLLGHPRAASDATTKHATVAFAERVASRYRPLGVRVSVLAPPSVRTPMIVGPDRLAMVQDDGMISPERLADAVVAGMREEAFLILPRPAVREYSQRKSATLDRWLDGMNRWRRKSLGAPAP